MVISKAEKDKIYVIKHDIEEGNELITRGSPVKFIGMTNDEERNFLFEDYRRKHWKLSENDFYPLPFNKEKLTEPTLVLKKFKTLILKNGPIFDIIAIIVSCIFCCVIAGIITFYNREQGSVALLFSVVGVSCLVGTAFLLKSDNLLEGYDYLYTNENIKELKILLNKKAERGSQNEK